MTHFSEPEKSAKAGRENNGKMIRVADVLHTLFSHFSGPQNSPLHAVGIAAFQLAHELGAKTLQARAGKRQAPKGGNCLL